MSRRRPLDHRPDWARWLVAEREARGFLQREFADRIHVSQQLLSNYERGVNRIPDDVAEQIAIALSLPEMEVRARLGLYVPEDQRDNLDEEVIRLPPGVKLTSIQRRALRALIDVFLEEQTPGGDIGPAGGEHAGHEFDDLRPASSDR